MKRTLLISIILVVVSGMAVGQVVISDSPVTAPKDTTYIFRINSDGADRLYVFDTGGVKVTGKLEVDSLQVNGQVYISSEGGSFIWKPNQLAPPPTHDLLRVTTRYFTVMGGGKINSQPLFGMGVNTETPNNMLDVNNGDIDVNTPTSGYMIGDQYVLRHKSLTDNIFVGVDAGLAFTTGSNNTFVGSGAGQNVGGSGNFTFIGYRAGYQNLGGSTNTFLGSMAGYSEMGDENVYVGWMTGYNSSQASYHNTFMGNLSGFNNKIGDNNTFIGIGSGLSNQSGNNNVALGANAGMGNAAQNNSVALGAGAVATNSSQMILGNNTMRVGIGLSSDVLGPQNKLEIDAGINGFNPTLAGNVGASGLRLRDLWDQTLPVANSRNVFLSVDGAGDVILVGPPSSSSGSVDNGLSLSGPSAGAIHLGQSTGASGDPAQLLDNREVPMYGHNFYFKGDLAVNQDMVEMGDNTILALTPITGTKLNVQTQTEQSAGLFVNRTNLVNQWNTFGLQGLKLMGTNFENVGVHGYAELDPNAAPGPVALVAIGVKGDAQARANAGTMAIAYGVWGEAVDNQTAVNYGGYFKAANAIGNNYAVYGDALGIGGTPGPGTPAGPTFAGYFNGDVYITNTYGPSDQKLKQDVRSIDGGLGIIMSLKPHTYYYRQQDFPGMALPSGMQYGLIAQEVEQVLPELVKDNVQPASYDDQGNQVTAAVDFKSMNYQELIPILIEAVQEQQAIIEKQQAQIDELNRKMEEK
jgi:hypothetical protein